MQLKAALKVQPQPSAWIDALALVHVGVRSALKEDIAATATEMVPQRWFTEMFQILWDT